MLECPIDCARPRAHHCSSRRPGGPSPETSLSKTLIPLVVVIFASLPAAPALGERFSFSPLDRDVLEQTAIVPAAAAVDAFTASGGGHVILTRFCGGKCLQCEGKSLVAANFETSGRDCVDYPQGIEVPQGETVRCTNVCETVNAALFSGVRRP